VTNYWLCLVGFGLSCLEISFSEERTNCSLRLSPGCKVCLCMSYNVLKLISFIVLKLTAFYSIFEDFQIKLNSCHKVKTSTGGKCSYHLV